MNSKKTSTDKVCGVCGGIGYADDMATCCGCKMISEHFYCMQRLEFTVPEVWYCAACAPSAQLSDTKRKNIASGLWVKKAKTGAKRSSFPLAYWNNSEEINGNDSQPAGIHVPLHVDLSQRTDVSKKRLSVTGSDAIHTTQTLSCNPSSSRMVDKGKTKFINPEAAALRQSTTKRSFSGLKLRFSGLSQMDHAPVSKMTSSINIGLKAGKAVHLVTGGASSPEVQLSNACGDTEAKSIQNYRASEKDASGAIWEKERSEGPVGSGLCHSPRHGTVLAESKCDLVACQLNDEKRKIADRALEKEAHGTYIKEEPTECSNAQINHSPLNNISSTDAKYGSNGVVHHPNVVGHEVNKSVGKTMCSDALLEKPGFQCTDHPSTLLVVSNDNHPHRPIPEAKWKGDFEISHAAPEVYNGFQACIPGKVSLKAYDMLKQLPEKIKFNLHPRLDVWPKIFHLEPPTVEDIGLYFFPCELQRSRETYSRLVETVDRHDLALKCCLDDVELLIFTSTQLPKDSIEFYPEVFIWGVFRHFKRKRQSRPEPKQFHAGSFVNNAHSKNLFMERNVETETAEAIVVENAPRSADHSPILDIPPGFSIPYNQLKRQQ